MRIVVKPVGIAVLVAAVAALVFFASRRNSDGSGASTPVALASDRRPSGQGGTEKLASVMVKPGGTNLLYAGDFEGDFTPITIVPPPKTAQISGVTVSPWLDNSGWATVGIDYAKDTSRPHGGKTCQRIVVHDVAPNCQVQYAQVIGLKPGTTYRGAIWARASSPTTVELALRQVAPPRVCYQKQYETIGPEWRQLSIDATVGADGKVGFMVILQQPNTTVWVDDAVLTAVS